LFLDNGREEQIEIEKKLIDKLLVDYKNPQDLMGEQGLLKQLIKSLAERAMHTELTQHRLKSRGLRLEAALMARGYKPAEGSAGAVILNASASSSHFWFSMYPMIVFVPTVAQKCPRAHNAAPVPFA
jgi:hypothetical protein